MAKKENYDKNHQAAEAWQKRKRELGQTLAYQTAQQMYRRACLQQRADENRLTEKNRAEMKRLGM